MSTPVLMFLKLILKISLSQFYIVYLQILVYPLGLISVQKENLYFMHKQVCTGSEKTVNVVQYTRTVS